MSGRERAAVLTQEQGATPLFCFLFKGMGLFYLIALLAYQVLP